MPKDSQTTIAEKTPPVIFTDDLCNLDTILQKAFDVSEKEYSIPWSPRINTFSTAFRLAFREQNNGWKKWLPDWRCLSPVYFWLALAFSSVFYVTSIYVRPFGPLASMFLAAVFMLLFIFSVTGYRKAFIRDRTHYRDDLTPAFGFVAPALVVSGINDFLVKSEVSVEAVELDRIIKLVKVGNDVEDVNFGTADAWKKGVLALPVLLVEGISSVPNGRLSSVLNFLNEHPRYWALVLFQLFVTGWLTYLFLIDPIVAKKKRKRYLVALNLMYEFKKDKKEFSGKSDSRRLLASKFQQKKSRV